jgi:hypothetical protein
MIPAILETAQGRLKQTQIRFDAYYIEWPAFLA